MLLRSVTGISFEISPFGYEFPDCENRTDDEDTDANWIVTRGSATSSDGQTSEFLEPFLMTTDARELTGWLREAAAGRIEPRAHPTDDELWMFLEPTLAFSVESRNKDRITIRVHLSSAIRPNWAPAEHDLFETFILIDLSNAELILAAADWERELAHYPVR
jgi:hypothetical protein